MIHAHNHPLMLAAADILIENANKKRLMKYLEYSQLENEDDKQAFIKQYENTIPKRTPLQILKSKTWKMMILKKFPFLNDFNKKNMPEKETSKE